MIRHSKFWNKKIDFLAVKAGLLLSKQQKSSIFNKESLI